MTVRGWGERTWEYTDIEASVDSEGNAHEESLSSLSSSSSSPAFKVRSSGMPLVLSGDGGPEWA